MRQGTITFDYFDKGDIVMSYNGVGIVVEDEKEIYREYDLRWSEVLVQHKNAYSNNINNRPVLQERETLLRITKEEYEAGI
jgi:hypothetical protein